MWVERTSWELAAERRAYRLANGVRGLALGCLVCLACVPHPGFYVSITVRILVALAGAVLFFVWLRRAYWRRIHSAVKICQKCNVVKVDEIPGACVCGGKLRPLREMKWVEPHSNPTPEDAVSAFPSI